MRFDMASLIRHSKPDLGCQADPPKHCSVKEMTRKPAVVMVVVLFALNAAILVGMKLLPEESPVFKDVFPEAVDMEKAVTEKGSMKDMAGAHYVRLYRKHTTANTVASVVLLLNACFIFAVGVVLCAQRQMKGVKTTEPPAGADAEDRAAQP